MKEKILTTPRSYGKNMPELFEQLEAAGYEVIKNPTGGIIEKETMKELVKDVSGIIVGVDPLDAEVLACAPKLRAIAKYGVGVDNIDLDYCKEHGIKVSRTVGANSEAVADYAMTLIMAVARKAVMIDRKCRTKDWSKISTRDVSGATLGLFGLGAIGKHVAKRAQGFGMKVLAYDPFWPEEYAKANDITRADAETIFKNADFISLHLPLMDSTKNFVGEKEIAMMKKDAVIINTARGGLIDEAALLAALKEGRIYGAGIDAFAQEPPEDPAWFELDNVVIGSHCAASTTGATQNMGRMATENVIRDLAE
ncbi:MAG: phosphoglycerate dehydrogenase [Clostridia bacterium]|nr:phosphoglycerate dehydrogenase [Clostridia bacterium]MBP3653240.1 phosphoglycerate dehydrogenase [Clostridia bacterium]